MNWRMCGLHCNYLFLDKKASIDRVFVESKLREKYEPLTKAQHSRDWFVRRRFTGTIGSSFSYDSFNRDSKDWKSPVFDK